MKAEFLNEAKQRHSLQNGCLISIEPNGTILKAKLEDIVSKKSTLLAYNGMRDGLLCTNASPTFNNHFY